MNEKAIRAGCNASDAHLTCSYPDCKCKQLPIAIQAALNSVTPQSLVGVERAAPPLRAREEIAALRELYEWYDRDGSVGAAADVFEKHRALLAQRIEHEPSKLGVEGSVLPAPPVAKPIVAEQRPASA